MLHIHNGDSTAGTMRAVGLPGEHFAFREALATGPTPRGLAYEEWVATRAAHLAASAGVDAEPIWQDWAEIEAMLKRAAAQDETILWFEHDLHCQINLIYLLARLAETSARPSLICVGEFLGAMPAERMAALFDTRHPVTEAELRLAQAAWDAYSAPVPRALEALLAADTSALPFLRDTLLRHLGRFPSVRNGLGAIENHALRLIADGHATFPTLFPALMKTDPIYGGLGDLAIQDVLTRLTESPAPLLAREGDRFSLTPAGQEALAGQRDALAARPLDQWLGGAHLTPSSLWRWDEARQTLLPDAP